MDVQRVACLLSASLSLVVPSQHACGHVCCLSWILETMPLMTNTIPDPGRMQFDY